MQRCGMGEGGFRVSPAPDEGSIATTISCGGSGSRRGAWERKARERRSSVRVESPDIRLACDESGELERSPRLPSKERGEPEEAERNEAVGARPVA